MWYCDQNTQWKNVQIQPWTSQYSCTYTVPYYHQMQYGRSDPTESSGFAHVSSFIWLSTMTPMRFEMFSSWERVVQADFQKVPTVAVPGKHGTLLRCVFRLHSVLCSKCCSAELPAEWVSWHVKYSCIYIAQEPWPCPFLLRRFKRGKMRSKYAME